MQMQLQQRDHEIKILVSMLNKGAAAGGGGAAAGGAAVGGQHLVLGGGGGGGVSGGGAGGDGGAGGGGPMDPRSHAGGGPVKAWGTPPRQGRPTSPRQVLERQARAAQRVEAVGASGTEEAALLLARNEVRARTRVRARARVL